MRAEDRMSGKRIGLGLACIGWAGFIAGLVLGHAGEAAGATLVAIAQWVIVTGLAIAVIGATENGFGALDRFFAEIAARSRAAAPRPEAKPVATAPNAIAPAAGAFDRALDAAALPAALPAVAPAALAAPVAPAPPPDFAARFLDEAEPRFAPAPSPAAAPPAPAPRAAPPRPASVSARPSPAVTRPAPTPAAARPPLRPEAPPPAASRRVAAPSLPRMAPTHVAAPAPTPRPDLFPAPPPPANLDRAPAAVPASLPYALDAEQPYFEAVEPAEPPPRAPPPPASNDEAGPIGSGEVGGRPYRLFADGAVEIDTLLGSRRFASMEAACRFVGARAA